MALYGFARLGVIPGGVVRAMTARLVDYDLVSGIPLRDLSMVAWAAGTLRYATRARHACERTS